MIVRVTVVLQLRCRTVAMRSVRLVECGQKDVHVRIARIQLILRYREVGSADVILISRQSEKSQNRRNVLYIKIKRFHESENLTCMYSL